MKCIKKIPSGPSQYLDNLIKSSLRLMFKTISGKRKCMGCEIAKSEWFLQLSHLLQNFTFAFPEDHPKLTPDLLKPDRDHGALSLQPQPFKTCALPR